MIISGRVCTSKLIDGDDNDITLSNKYYVSPVYPAAHECAPWRPLLGPGRAPLELVIQGHTPLPRNSLGLGPNPLMPSQGGINDS
jgi:hypothetical protein